MNLLCINWIFLMLLLAHFMWKNEWFISMNVFYCVDWKKQAHIEYKNEEVSGFLSQGNI